MAHPASLPEFSSSGLCRGHSPASEGPCGGELGGWFLGAGKVGTAGLSVPKGLTSGWGVSLPRPGTAAAGSWGDCSDLGQAAGWGGQQLKESPVIIHALLSRS